MKNVITEAFGPAFESCFLKKNVVHLYKIYNMEQIQNLNLQFELNKVILLLEPNSEAAQKIKERNIDTHNLKLN
jgi:hypothetical protein